MPLEQNAKLFKFVLKTLPIVEDNQDIHTLIEQELKKQTTQTTRNDFNKLEKLGRFKKIIEEHCQRENRNIVSTMTQMGVKLENTSKGAQKLQLLFAEKDLLDGLTKVLIDQAEQKKHH